MKLTFKHSRTTAAVIIALSLSACVRFDTRMQANGSFDYEDATLIEPYQIGDFTDDEARTNHQIPELTEQQIALGFSTTEVDVRPPTQFMAVLDGVLLEATEDGRSKVWFNAFNQDDDMLAKVWNLLESYLAENNIEIVKKDEQSQQLETGIFRDEIIFGSALNRNSFLKESSYRFTIEKQEDGHSVALIVDVLSYEETNEGEKLTLNLVGSTKKDIEVRFINSVLEYGYQLREAEQRENIDSQPLSIKLGFDDNHQSGWLVDSGFIDTWAKLPELFTQLGFEIVEEDTNLGYFLLKFTQPDDEYWAENNLNKFELEKGEYFVQLGEISGSTTSISWLDEDKKPLPDQKVTEIYLSITDQVRGVLIEQDKQTKEF